MKKMDNRQEARIKELAGKVNLMEMSNGRDAEYHPFGYASSAPLEPSHREYAPGVYVYPIGSDCTSMATYWERARKAWDTLGHAMVTGKIAAFTVKGTVVSNLAAVTQVIQLMDKAKPILQELAKAGHSKLNLSPWSAYDLATAGKTRTTSDKKARPAMSDDWS